MTMETSVLSSTKKILGIAESYTAFDLDIITHINAAFSILSQLGIGPSEGFYVETKDDIWGDYVTTPFQLSLVKTYVFLKVRMLFDPPTTSYLIEAMNKQIEEFEWRLSVYRENDIPLPVEEVS